MYELSTLVPTREDALTVQPHCLDVRLRTSGINIVDFSDYSADCKFWLGHGRHVTFKLNGDLAVVLKTYWDTEAAALDTQRLIGVLVETTALLDCQMCFIIILASRGDFFERVGIAGLSALSKYTALHASNEGAYMYRDNVCGHGIPPYDGGPPFAYSKSCGNESGKWWEQFFKDNGRIKIQ
jgi:hypothetical protein